MESTDTIFSAVSQYSEFWSVIVGACVGGFIAYLIQITALRESRNQRAEELLRLHKVLGNSLIVKMIKIYSNFQTLYNHLEECFAAVDHAGSYGEPWTFTRPLATLPSPVVFSSAELSMLIAMNSDEVFNSILPLDTIHNTLWDTVRKQQTERKLLLEQLPADNFVGNVGQATLGNELELKLRPQMIAVNTMIEQLFSHVKRSRSEAETALFSLHTLLQDKLGLTYKLETISSSDA